MMFFWWMFGCQGEDDQFQKEKSVFEAYSRFEAAREKKDWGVAEEALKEAIEHQPDMRNLRLWEIFVLYEKGDYDACVEQGLAYLERMPGEGGLRYNVAACLAIKGDTDAAARHLRVLVSDGRVHPIEVAEDKDFESMVKQSKYSDVIQSPELVVGVPSVPSSMMLGAEETIRIQARFRSTQELNLVAPQDSAVQILKVSQVFNDMSDFMAMCKIDVQIKAQQSDNLIIDDWIIETQEDKAAVPKIDIEIVQIKPLEHHISRPLEPFLPSQWLKRASPPYAEQVIIGDETRIVVAAPPNAQIEHNSENVQVLELWLENKLQVKGIVISQSKPVDVAIHFGREVLFEKSFAFP